MDPQRYDRTWKTGSAATIVSVTECLPDHGGPWGLARIRNISKNVSQNTNVLNPTQAWGELITHNDSDSSEKHLREREEKLAEHVERDHRGWGG